jgi:hypothetical protein
LYLSNYADTSHWNLESWAYLRETITINFHVLKIGVYKVKSEIKSNNEPNSVSGIYLLVEDDVPRGRWEIDETKENYLEITHIDALKKIIEGEFQLHFVAERKNNAPQFSSKFSFHCGKFKAGIFE